MEISGITGGAQTAAQFNVSKAKSESFEEALTNAISEKDSAELKKACKSFESYYIQMMLKEMRSTVHSEGGIFPKGQAEQIFEGMLDEEIAKSAAERGVGLADMMYQQLSKNI